MLKSDLALQIPAQEACKLVFSRVSVCQEKLIAHRAGAGLGPFIVHKLVLPESANQGRICHTDSTRTCCGWAPGGPS